MATHRRLSSVSSLRSSATTFLPSPRLHFSRRTIPSSRARVIVLSGVAFVTLVACTFILRALTSGAQPPVAQQYSYHQYRPSSRVFREGAGPHRTPAAHDRRGGYSFAQHPGQELGALVGFLTALASNSIPPSVDPGHHIDPELVLGFNTRAESHQVVEEVENIIADTWARNPVVVFSELHSTVAPASREVKKIMSSLNLYPAPTVFEIDQREDADVLRPLLTRLTGRNALPVVIIGGETIGSLAELKSAQDSGTLQNLVASAGAVIDGAKKRKRHH